MNNVFCSTPESITSKEESKRHIRQKRSLKGTLIATPRTTKLNYVHHQSCQSPSHGGCGSPPQGGQPLLLQVPRQFWMNTWCHETFNCTYVLHIMQSVMQTLYILAMALNTLEQFLLLSAGKLPSLVILKQMLSGNRRIITIRPDKSHFCRCTNESSTSTSGHSCYIDIT